MSALQSSRSVAAVAAGSLESGPLPFDLLTEKPSGKLEVFRPAGAAITDEDLAVIMGDSRRLFIQTAQTDQYLDYAFERIGRIITRPLVSPGEKAHILRGVGRRIMLELLRKPGSRVLVEQAGLFVRANIELLLQNRDAARHLFALSSAEGYPLSHSINVSTFCIMIGEQIFGQNEGQLHCLGLCGLLHDLGMTQIDTSVFLKRGALDDMDSEKVRQHPLYGERLVAALGLPEEVSQAARQHHERLDGSGYPDGIGREEIGLHSRIVAVADVFDALTSDRLYRKRLTQKEALAQMSGKRAALDRQVFNALLRTFLSNDLAARQPARQQWALC